MGARRKKTRTHVATPETSVTPPPRSFIVKAGEVGKPAARLVRDLRRVMHPNTAAKLRERAQNKLRDYVAMAGPLHVSHLFAVSRNTRGSGNLSLRVGRLPRGPTVAFRVKRFSLMTDVAAVQRTPKTSRGALFAHAPLLVLNNFPTDRNEYKLLATTLQNMFPSIHVNDMKIAHARRVVLFNYHAETDTVDFRHYAIDVKPTGVTKGVKRLVDPKQLPDLSNYRDIADYVHREAVESDVEDDSKVELPGKYAGRNNRAQDQRAIKLTELGPRMDLSLVKIQEGMCSGEVLYHKYVHKTPQEVAALRAAKKEREQLRQQRRAQQEANVARKRAALETKKQERAERRAAAKAAGQTLEDSSDEEYDGELEASIPGYGTDTDDDDGDLDDLDLEQDFDDAHSDREDQSESENENQMSSQPPAKKQKKGVPPPPRKAAPSKSAPGKKSNFNNKRQLSNKTK